MALPGSRDLIGKAMQGGEAKGKNSSAKPVAFCLKKKKIIGLFITCLAPPRVSGGCLPCWKILDANIWHLIPRTSRPRAGGQVFVHAASTQLTMGTLGFVF